MRLRVLFASVIILGLGAGVRAAIPAVARQGVCQPILAQGDASIAPAVGTAAVVVVGTISSADGMVAVITVEEGLKGAQNGTQLKVDNRKLTAAANCTIASSAAGPRYPQGTKVLAMLERAPAGGAEWMPAGVVSGVFGVDGDWLYSLDTAQPTATLDQLKAAVKANVDASTDVRATEFIKPCNPDFFKLDKVAVYNGMSDIVAIGSFKGGTANQTTLVVEEYLKGEQAGKELKLTNFNYFQNNDECPLIKYQESRFRNDDRVIVWLHPDDTREKTGDFRIANMNEGVLAIIGANGQRLHYYPPLPKLSKIIAAIPAQPAPASLSVSGLNPGQGPRPGATEVRITGAGFNGLTGPNAVMFGSAPAASYRIISDTEIIAVAPPAPDPECGKVQGDCTVDVTVTRGGSAKATGRFTYLAPAPAASAGSVSPPGGPRFGRTAVVISGSGFAGITCPDDIRFGSVPAPSCRVDSDGRVVAIAPAAVEADCKDAGECTVPLTLVREGAPPVQVGTHVYRAAATQDACPGDLKSDLDVWDCEELPGTLTVAGVTALTSAALWFVGGRRRKKDEGGSW